MSKPTSNRLLYFFVVVGAIVPVLLVAAGWSFLRTEDGQGIWSGMALAFRGAGHPAVAELKGIGCEQAIITTIGSVNDTQQARLSAEERAQVARSETRDTPWVMCTNVFGEAPSCETVAATHGPFAPEQDQVVVTVLGNGSRLCAGVHARSGERLGEITRETLFGELEPSEAEASEPAAEGEAP